MRYLPTLLLGLGASSLARNETAGSIFKRFTSNNWCGPVTSGSGIVSVEGTWTVPEVFLPKGGWLSERYQFYQWVGLDGTRDCGALLQGGTGQTIEKGRVSYYTWFEFWPAPPVYGHVKVSPGDTVYVRVDATSPKSGTVYVENVSTGERYREMVTSPGPSLCFATAEWIAEAPGSPPEPLPAFTQYDFTDCRAQTSSGNVLSLFGAQDWIMYNGKERLCRPARRGNFATSIIYG